MYGFVDTFGQHWHNTHVGVLVGESTTLHCNHPCSVVSWWFNSKLIVDSGRLVESHIDSQRFNFTCDHDNLYGVDVWGELTILSAQIEDSGHYECRDYVIFEIFAYFRVTVICKLRVIFINLLLSSSVFLAVCFSCINL